MTPNSSLGKGKSEATKRSPKRGVWVNQRPDWLTAGVGAGPRRVARHDRIGAELPWGGVRRPMSFASKLSRTVDARLPFAREREVTANATSSRRLSSTPARATARPRRRPQLGGHASSATTRASRLPSRPARLPLRGQYARARARKRGSSAPEAGGGTRSCSDRRPTRSGGPSRLEAGRATRSSRTPACRPLSAWFESAGSRADRIRARTGTWPARHRPERRRRAHSRCRPKCRARQSTAASATRRGAGQWC